MKSVSVSRCSPVLEPAHRKPLSSETDFTPSVSELLAAFNLALDEHGLKRDALAAAACMSPGHFSKVTTDPRLAGFPRVLASMPDEAFLLFLARYAPLRGGIVRQVSTVELAADFQDTVSKLVRLGRVLMVRPQVKAFPRS
jgi:hypothetical protein